MGTVKMVPPDDIHNNAVAVIVDRGSEGERHWRERGYVTEEEVAGTGLSLPVNPERTEDQNQERPPFQDQSDAMKEHIKQSKKKDDETSVEKGEGAPGFAGPPGDSPLKLSPDIEPESMPDRPTTNRTAMGQPTKDAPRAGIVAAAAVAPETVSAGRRETSKVHAPKTEPADKAAARKEKDEKKK